MFIITKIFFYSKFEYFILIIIVILFKFIGKFYLRQELSYLKYNLKII